MLKTAKNAKKNIQIQFSISHTEHDIVASVRAVN
mgnify:FL=1